MGDSGDQQIDGARIVGATGPQYSADGRWVWDGRQWIPAPPVETTLHQFSDVGAILYDGRANFLTHCECRITNRRVILQSDRAGMHQIPLSIVTKVKPNFGLISSELDVDLPGMTFRFTGNGKEKTLALYRAIQEATLDSPQQRIDDPHRQNAQTADSEPTAPLPRRRAYQGRSGPVAMGITVVSLLVMVVSMGSCAVTQAGIIGGVAAAALLVAVVSATYASLAK